MSDDRTGEPEWVPVVSMEVTTSTEGAGPGESCADPVQPGVQASTSAGGSRDHLHAYFQARLSAIESRMGINPIGTPEPEETMEVLEVLLAPTLNPQEDLGAPVMEDAHASTETNPRRAGGPSSAQPLSGRETPDTTMETLPGTEGEGDGEVGRTEEEGASPQPPAPARCAQGERGLGLEGADPIPVEPSPEAEGPDPGWLDWDRAPSMPWTTFAQVQKERDQLARKFDALQDTIPKALTTKVTRLLQLEMRTAQLQSENARLTRKQREMHEANVRLGATLAAQSTGGEPAQHSQAGAPAPDGQPSREGGTAPGAQRSDQDWIEQSETIERLRAERNQLGRRLADLLAVLPAAIAARVTRLQQLEERAAQLQRNYDRLAQEGEKLRKEREVWEIAIQENAALRALLGAREMNPQAKSGPEEH